MRIRVARARLHIPLALLIAVSLTGVLAGCDGSSGNGIASKSAAEILAASRTAAEHASSVHVLSNDSQGRLSLTTNLELAQNGGRATLSFLDLGYEVIHIGDTLYFKGSRALYARLFGAGDSHVPQGTWLKAGANTSTLAGLAGLTDLASRLDLLLRSSGPLTKGATTRVDGQPAIELKAAAKLFTGSLYIATTGKPYPIELVKHGRETGQTSFTDWNQPIKLSAPADAVDLGKLEHKG